MDGDSSKPHRDDVSLGRECRNPTDSAAATARASEYSTPGPRSEAARPRGIWSAGFLDYALPQTPGGFRKLSEIPVRTNQASCVFSWKNVALPFAPVDFHRKPEPVPRT